MYFAGLGRTSCHELAHLWRDEACPEDLFTPSRISIGQIIFNVMLLYRQLDEWHTEIRIQHLVRYTDGT